MLPLQYRSSALLATDSSLSSGPRTWHITSSRAVSELGIPIAEQTFTHTPLKRVAKPQ